MIKYLSLFSGIGAFEKAMINLKIPFELVGFSEIDDYAAKSYQSIFDVPASKNLGDITKINERKLPHVDFITYGFPCQDISLAGKQMGFENENGEKTRSGLFFDALRIIESCRPKIAIAENVKNLTGKRFKKEFSIVLESLENAGYNNYWKVLNAKDFGIPQQRERVFIVSIRKDIDNKIFEFPKEYELKKKLVDLLEDSVDDCFYLSQKGFNYVFNMKVEAKGIGFSDAVDTSFVNPDICNTLAVKSSGSHYQRSGTSTFVSDSRKKMMVKDMKEKIDNGADWESFRCRFLTPKEQFRLSGFSDEDYEKAAKVNCKTRLWMQTGNTIVVDVAEELLCMMFDEDGNFFV